MNEILALSLKDPSQRAGTLAVLKQAFSSHPFLPENATPEMTGSMLELMLDTFGNTDKAWLHGMRLDGQIDCVAFSYDAHFEPSFTEMTRFVFRLAAILGWRMTIRFFILFMKRPKHSQRYLELLLLATTPACHGKGLGRRIMNFLYGFAATQGFRGVLLDVARETPAYHFYVKEGFVTDKEQTFNNNTLCHMRRDNPKEH